MDFLLWRPYGYLIMEKQAFISQYFDEYGHLLLTPGGNPIENGILFGVYFYYLIEDRLDHDDETRFIEALISCEVDYGLYDRHQTKDDLNSHDNYIGIVAGAILFSLPTVIREIVRHGEKNYWFYDNTGEDNPKAWRRGSDIAYYQLADKKTPSIFNMAWLGIDTVISSFQGIEEHSSEKLLVWVRSLSIRKLKVKGIGGTYLSLLDWFFFWKLERQGGVKKLFATYFSKHDINAFVD